MPFKKGQSGCPGGKSPIPADVREIARGHTRDALEVLSKIMHDGTAPPQARVSAANSLLDRGWGKPAQAVTDAEGGPPRVLVEIVKFAEGTP